jgi:AraC-like DNA-binding protein
MSGQAFFWNLGNVTRPLRVFYLGRSMDVALHEHHLTQICVGLNEPVRVHRGSGEPVEHRAVLIPTDAPHLIATASDSPIAVLYLSSETTALRAKTGAGPEAITLDERLLDALRDAHDREVHADEAAALFADVLAASVGTIDESIRDARVRSVVGHLRRDPVAKHSATSLAGRVALSTRRLSELFREETGLPIRRYVVFLRLRIAIARVLRGSSLTEAAHAAGFSDLAHLSHAFRDMFGMSPSFGLEPARRPRFVLTDDP